MDLDELEATNGGRRQNTSCCTPVTPITQQMSPEKATHRSVSPDGHLGGVERDGGKDYVDEWERWAEHMNSLDPRQRNHYGFLLPEYFGE